MRTLQPASAAAQSLAYASLAGLSATQGLHSNAVSAFPAAALANSRYLQTGCVAMSSLLVGGALLAAGLTPSTPEFASAAALLAGVVGVARVALGALNGGALLRRMPTAVLEGFTLGVVWLVFATQLPVILGVAPPPGAHFVAAAAALLAQPALWQLGSIATAAGTAACLLGGKRCAIRAVCLFSRCVLRCSAERRLHPLFPGAVIATALGCAASAAGLPVGPTVGADTPLRTRMIC